MRLSNHAVRSGSAGVTTVVDPAANLNGMMVAEGYVSVYGNSDAAIHIDTTAPAGASDMTKEALLNARSGNAAQEGGVRYCPPGTGLFLSIANSSTYAAVRYELLT